MHINFDNDEIEVKPTFDPKKNVNKTKEKQEELNFNSTETKNDENLNFDGFSESPKEESSSNFFEEENSNSTQEPKQEEKGSFFGEEPKKDLEKSTFFETKETKSSSDFFEHKDSLKNENITEIKDKSGGDIMDINLNEISSKMDDIKGIGKSLKDDLDNLKESDKIVTENINAEFEKIKGQIKSQSEEIKTNLDEVKTTIEQSREDIKLNISKIKVTTDIAKENKESTDGKKSLLNKKASTDSLFRVIFLMIFITLGTVVYFGLTIMEDLTKRGSSKVIERIIPAKIPANVTSAKVDTTKFENEARAIRGEISNLNRSMGEFKNILNEIKNIKSTPQIVQTSPTTTTTRVPMPTPISETKKEIIREVKFDDSSINQKLSILSNEFNKISDKLNQINSKLSKVTNEVVYGKKELINKIDTVEKGLGYKIDARTPKPIKIYSDGLQIRDE